MYRTKIQQMVETITLRETEEGEITGAVPVFLSVFLFGGS